MAAAPDDTTPADAATPPRWEHTLRMVPGVELPERDAVVGQRWLQLAQAPPAPGDVLVVDADETQVYFRASEVDTEGAPLRSFLNAPDRYLGPAIHSGRYDGLAIDPRSFNDVALALERVSGWLSASGREFTRISDTLVLPATGFQGTAAGAFQELVDHLRTAFTSYHAQLNTDGPVRYADAVTASGTSARYFLTDLWNTHQHWRSLPEHLPLGAVASVLREAAIPSAMDGRAELPENTRFGPVDQPATWDAVEAAAKQRWLESVAALDSGGRTATQALARQYRNTTDTLAPLVTPGDTRDGAAADAVPTSTDPAAAGAHTQNAAITETAGEPVTVDSPPATPGGLADATLFTPSAMAGGGLGSVPAEATSFDGAIGRSVAPPGMVFALPLGLAAGPRGESVAGSAVPVGLATVGRPVRGDEEGDASRIRMSVDDDDDRFGVAAAWAPDGPIGAPQPSGAVPGTPRESDDAVTSAFVHRDDAAVSLASVSVDNPVPGEYTELDAARGQSTEDAERRVAIPAGVPPFGLLGVGAGMAGGGPEARSRISWEPEDSGSWGTDLLGQPAALGRGSDAPTPPVRRAVADGRRRDEIRGVADGEPVPDAAAFPGTVTTQVADVPDTPVEPRRHR